MHAGVGRNVAEAVARCGQPPCFITAVGADSQGQALVDACKQLGMVRPYNHHPSSLLFMMMDGDDRW